MALLSPAAVRRTGPELDRSVPALLLKLGSYPLHHGGVGVVRSLGRRGVDVYAVTEGAYTPAALSRHLRGRFSWPTTGHEAPGDLLAGLDAIGDAIGRRAVLVPTDDEAAIVVAELADALSERFLLPRPASPERVRALASKEGLHALCRAHGAPTAATVAVTSPQDVERYAAHGDFPVVVKNSDAFGRRAEPVVRTSTVVPSASDLRALARGWPENPNVVLQEYIPGDAAQDWIVHSYTGERSVVFTGVKVRSWPPRAGVTSFAYATWNAGLADLATAFTRAVGFSGVADMDWRLDRRDGRFKLLDFNPRVGAQFRLFEDAAGVDVVRAAHLDLTGRPLPAAPFPEGRRFVSEDLDLRARPAYRSTTSGVPRAAGTELAWLALDDPMPVLPVAAGRLRPLVGRVTRRLTGR